MKTIKKIGFLALVWLTSIIALAGSFSIYFMHDMKFEINMLGTFLLLIFYNIIFSFPAFIFFTLFSMLILKSKLNNWKKKGLIILVNYTDIIGTVLVLYFILDFYSLEDSIAKNFKFLKSITSFYPFWVLITASTGAILALPLKKITETNKPIL